MEAVNTFIKRITGWLPARVALGAMAWLGFINLYMVRINLSVIIVAMVGRNTSDATHSYCHNITGGDVGENQSDTTNTTGALQQGEFDWSETIQGLVLGSFSYGYALTQVVGGRLAEVYGVKWLFGGCILAGGVSNLLSPAAARLHYGALIALRVLQGLFQAVSWPSMYVCLAQWIPPVERPRFMGYVVFGSTLGTAITLPLMGLVVDALGWAAAFYISGALSLVWCVVWALFMHSTPAQHPRISPEELQYIESAIRTSGTSRMRTPRVPWRRILISLPVWAIIFCDVSTAWSFSFFFSQLPTFMKNILGFSIRENGAISALPFLCRYVGAVVMSSLASWVMAKGHLSILNTRRVFCVIGMIVPAALIVVLIQVGCDWRATIAIFCIALFFNGAISSGHFVSVTDITPNFPGTVFGLSNTAFSIMAFIAPVVMGSITDGQQTLGQWKKVFWVFVPTNVLTVLFFLIFASGTVQPWNYHPEETTDPAATTMITANNPDEMEENMKEQLTPLHRNTEDK